jgi:hypothetical protein
MHRLTKQEQLVLCLAAALLVIGWGVKLYRSTRPPVIATQQAKP